VERTGVEPVDVEHINYVFRLTIGLCVCGGGVCVSRGVCVCVVCVCGCVIELDRCKRVGSDQ